MRKIMIIGLLVLTFGCAPPSTADWIQQLKDTDVVKRRQAIRELGERTGEPEQVLPALIEALGDDNGYVRRDAAITLGKFGAAASEAAPLLAKALKDKDHQVRVAAGAALKKIDPRFAKKAGVH